MALTHPVVEDGLEPRRGRFPPRFRDLGDLRSHEREWVLSQCAVEFLLGHARLEVCFGKVANSVCQQKQLLT